MFVDTDLPALHWHTHRVVGTVGLDYCHKDTLARDILHSSSVSQPHVHRTYHTSKPLNTNRGAPIRISSTLPILLCHRRGAKRQQIRSCGRGLDRHCRQGWPTLIGHGCCTRNRDCVCCVRPFSCCSRGKNRAVCDSAIYGGGAASVGDGGELVGAVDEVDIFTSDSRDIVGAGCCGGGGGRRA